MRDQMAIGGVTLRGRGEKVAVAEVSSVLLQTGQQKNVF